MSCERYDFSAQFPGKGYEYCSRWIKASDHSDVQELCSFSDAQGGARLPLTNWTITSFAAGAPPDAPFDEVAKACAKGKAHDDLVPLGGEIAAVLREPPTCPREGQMCNTDADCPGSDDCPEAENQCNSGGFDPTFTCCWKAHTGSCR